MGALSYGTGPCMVQLLWALSVVLGIAMLERVVSLLAYPCVWLHFDCSVDSAIY